MSESTSGLVERIDITTPVKWERNRAWKIAGIPVIVAIAFSPTALMFGPELIWGYGKGIGIALGPIWIGFAVAFPRAQPLPSPTEETGS